MPRSLLVVTVAILLCLPLRLRPAESQLPVAGSGDCRACHGDIHQRWSDSIHGRMIQPAVRDNVTAVAGSTGKLRGRAYWRDGRFFIEENGVANRIDFTLGNRRVQHYLTRRDRGEIIVVHSSWDVRRREWFHSSEIVPGAPRDFTQQWNTSCVYCHATQQVQDVKGFDAAKRTYDTQWVESSASCERCHGPMAAHASVKRGDTPGPAPTSTLPLLRASTRSPAGARPIDDMKVCAQCHWAKTVIAPGFDVRAPYFDHYAPSLIPFDDSQASSSFWADGRPRRFSNEAAAFYLASCFQSGEATCMSCHDAHWNRTDGNLKLMTAPDSFCRQCHTGKESASHTHHLPGSRGSSCVNCHMPYTVEGVKDRMRDHTMIAPDPDNTLKYGIPNACEECHDDHSPEWISDHFNEWYPNRSPRLQQRAVAFTLARARDPRAVQPLVRLAENLSENPMIRASAAGYFVQYPGVRAAEEALLRLSADPEPMVRVEAARSLGAFETNRSITALEMLARDARRAIRSIAAGSLTGLAIGQPDAILADPDLRRAIADYRVSLETESDHPHIQVRLGALGLFHRDAEAARHAYESALDLDPNHADAHVGLAIVEEQAGRTHRAIHHAERAVAIANRPPDRELLDRLRKPR